MKIANVAPFRATKTMHYFRLKYLTVANYFSLSSSKASETRKQNPYPTSFLTLFFSGKREVFEALKTAVTV